MIMTDSEQGIYLPEGRACTYHQYRHFATYCGIWLPFFGSNGHQLTNWYKILVLTFLSTSTITIMTDRQWVWCTPTWGWDTCVPPIGAICYILRYSVTFFWLKWTPVDKLTPNLGFNIPFDLYNHDHDWQWAWCTPTWGSDMYVPQIQAICYVWRNSVTFFGLKWTPVDKVTQNLGFNIPFHLYIHDHHWKWAGCTPTWGSDMYVPPTQAVWYIWQYSVTFF